MQISTSKSCKTSVAKNHASHLIRLILEAMRSSISSICWFTMFYQNDMFTTIVFQSELLEPWHPAEDADNDRSYPIKHWKHLEMINYIPGESHLTNLQKQCMSCDSHTSKTKTTIYQMWCFRWCLTSFDFAQHCHMVPTSSAAKWLVQARLVEPKLLP